MNRPYVQRNLILSFGAIFFLTGAAKVWSSYGNSRVLEEYDPIFGMSFYRLMQLVGIAELALAFFCLASCRVVNMKNIRLAAILVAWFSTLLVGYRFGLSYVDWRHPCRCLGDFTQALHIPENVADDLMKSILSYLFIGSYGLLIWQWKTRLQMVEPPVGGKE